MVTLRHLKDRAGRSEVQEDSNSRTPWLPSITPRLSLLPALSHRDASLPASLRDFRDRQKGAPRWNGGDKVSLSAVLEEIGPASTASGAKELLKGLVRERRIDELEAAKCMSLMCGQKEKVPKKELEGISLMYIYGAVNGNIQLEDSKGPCKWNSSLLFTIFREHGNKNMDVVRILKLLDKAEFVCNATEDFITLLEGITSYTGKRTVPADAFLGDIWNNREAQVALLSFSISNSTVAKFDSAENVGNLQRFMDAVHPQVTYPFRSVLLVETLVDLDLREFLKAPAIEAPEILAMALAQANPSRKPGMELRRVLGVSLLQGILGRYPSAESIAAIRGVWEVDKSMMVASCASYWKAKGSMDTLLRVVNELMDLAKVLESAESVDFVMYLAIEASKTKELDLSEWLVHMMHLKGHDYARKLGLWLRASQDSLGPDKDRVILAVGKVIANLRTEGKTPTTIEPVVDTMTTHNVPDLSKPPGDEANRLLGSLYEGRLNMDEIIELVKLCRGKARGSQEFKIYESIVNSLFDEFRFLEDYPDRQLATYATLFGSLIKEKVFDQQRLLLALLYIRTSLEEIEQKPIPIGKRSEFGLYAIASVRPLLKDLPNFASRLLRVERLAELSPPLVNLIQNSVRGHKEIARGLVAPSAFERAIGIAQVDETVSPAMLSSMAQSLAQLSIEESETDAIGAGRQPLKSAVHPELISPAEVERANANEPVSRIFPDFNGGENDVDSPVEGPRVSSDGLNDIGPPDEEMMDKFHFIFNNLSASNLAMKERELLTFLDSSAHGKLAHYIVVKRASIEPNFHSLYIRFMDLLIPHIPNLISQILLLSYSEVKVCLNSLEALSRKSSNNERTILKSLGSWIGNLTLARDRPILRKHLDPHQLIFDAYSYGRLIAVLPFISKLIEPARRSRVFKANNPWTRSLLSLFKELYLLQDLKLNLKFEVPLLCKEFDVDLNDIAPSNILHTLRPPNKLTSPDFSQKNMQQVVSSPYRSPESPLSSPPMMPTLPRHSPKSVPQPRPQSSPLQHDLSMPLTQSDLQANARARAQVQARAAQLAQAQSQVPAPGVAAAAGLSAFSLSGTNATPVSSGPSLLNVNDRVAVSTVTQNASPLQLPTSSASTVIPNLAQHLDINSSLPLLQASPGLKALLPIAVDRAVREIISPVVERSCTIACITTRELALKDLGTAGPGDVNKFRRAATQMAQKLAASLAHVTCKEPLRVSMGNHLRSLLSASAPHDLGLVEQTVSVICTNNLSVGVAIIEQAATEKVTKDVEEVVRNALVGGLGSGLRGIGDISDATWSMFEEFGTERSDKWSQELVVERFRECYVRLRTLIAANVEKGLNLVPLQSGSQISNMLATVLGFVQRAERLQDTAILVAKELFWSMFQGEKGLYHDIHVKLLNGLRNFAPGLERSIVSWMGEGKGHKKWNCTVAVSLLAAPGLVDKEAWDDMVGGAIDTFYTGLTNRRAQPKDANGLPGKNNETSASPLDGEGSKVIAYAAYVVKVAIVDMRFFSAAEIPGVMESLGRVARTEYATKTLLSEELSKLLTTARTVVSRPSLTNAKAASIQGVANAAEPSSSTAGGTGNQDEQNSAVTNTTDGVRAGELAAREKVITMLSEWERALTIGGSGLSDYIGRVSTVLEAETAKEQFFRHALDIVCGEAAKALALQDQLNAASSERTNPYSGVDSVAKLFVILCRYEHVKAPGQGLGLALLTALLSSLVKMILQTRGDVRPQFRVMSNIVAALTIGSTAAESRESNKSRTDSKQSPGKFENGSNGNATAHVLNISDFAVLSCIAGALGEVSPLKAPAFAFSWLQLASHREIFPRLLVSKHSKGWPLFKKLLVDLLTFLAPHMGTGNIRLTDAIKTLYKGALRVLLVLLHDFPEFLCDYHFALCDAIPANCVQLRNLILSAFPKNMRLPDPFLPDLKVENLPDMQRPPRVLANYTGTLISMGIKSVVDAYLTNASIRAKATSLSVKSKLMYAIPEKERQGVSSTFQPQVALKAMYNIPAINALVLYIGQHAITHNQGSVARSSPHTTLFNVILGELDAEGHYHVFNAITNQLRYPNNHTVYFYRILLFLFSDAKSEALREQITRVLVERLIAQRPHPWGLLATFIELLKNPAYSFWEHGFTKCTRQVHILFKNVAQSCNATLPPPNHVNNATAVRG